MAQLTEQVDAVVQLQVDMFELVRGLDYLRLELLARV